MMNEKKPKWVCPVCNKPALYENLLIDGYFTDVLTSKQLPHDEREIVLQSDASWDPLVPAKNKNENNKDEKTTKSASWDPLVPTKNKNGNNKEEKTTKRPSSPTQDRIKKA